MGAAVANMTSQGTWRIRAAGEVYGPYTLAQMRQYAREGRLSANSIVAQGDSDQWISADQDALLIGLFQKSETKPTVKFGRKTAPVEASGAGVSKFVVIFEQLSGAGAGVEAALHKVGATYRLSESVWIVSGASTVAGIRNLLTPYMSLNDKLVVVDATRGTSAWSNLGPEADAKLHDVWR